MFLLINEHRSSIILQLELKRVKPHKSLMRFLHEFPLEFWKKVHIVSLFWIVFFPSTLGWMAVIQFCLMAKNKNCYALFIWWSRIMEGKDGQKVMPTLSKKWHLGMPYTGIKITFISKKTQWISVGKTIILAGAKRGQVDDMFIPLQSQKHWMYFCCHRGAAWGTKVLKRAKRARTTSTENRSE